MRVSRSLAEAFCRDIDFALQTGEFCGLIGGNGSGKTTLIRTIIGFVTPNRDWRQYPPRQPATQQVKDRLDNRPTVPNRRPTALSARGSLQLQNFPLRVRQATWQKQVGSGILPLGGVAPSLFRNHA